MRLRLHFEEQIELKYLQEAEEAANLNRFVKRTGPDHYQVRCDLCSFAEIYLILAEERTAGERSRISHIFDEEGIATAGDGLLPETKILLEHVIQDPAAKPLREVLKAVDGLKPEEIAGGTRIGGVPPGWRATRRYPRCFMTKIPAPIAMFNKRNRKIQRMNDAAISMVALVSLVLTALLFAGCTDLDTAPELPPAEGLPRGPSPESQKGVVDASNQFALDLYTRLAEDPANKGENIFFSPFSISSALAITYEGARGDTAREIREVFHFPGDSAMMRTGYASVIAGINRGSSAYELRTANALWAEQTYPFLPEYIILADRTYGAKVTTLDFITKPDESRLSINRWIGDQTNDKIKDLLPGGSITPETRLVITNAVYFRGTWVKQFDEKKTTVEDFMTGSGEIVRVPMMQRTDRNATYGYWENGNLQVLRMPYESDTGKELSMAVLLPREGDPGALEQSLSASILSELEQNLTTRQVMVSFPKFTMETRYALPGIVSAMGMQTAFTNRADLSGMDGTTDLFITDIIHQAFIEVNEEGTEAAAATAVIGGAGAASVEAPVPVFRADHPFLFIIRDDETGLILFIGRVEHPASP
ncbi:MAG TPA: serpin family protein [Methanoregulaceae archaeon]|nr:serpin family protein [Methanoregulaceae archaeon]